MRRLRIQSWLNALVLACILPATAATGFLVAQSYLRERAEIEFHSIQTARALTQAVDRYLSSAEAALSVLALSPHLTTGDFAAFHRDATEVLRTQPGNGIVLADVTGQQVMSTIKPYGEPLPRSGLPDLVSQIARSGRPAFSDFYIGATSRQAQVAVGVPVLRDGRVAYVLTMGVLPEFLREVLSNENLPENWVVSIFDSKGTIVARTHAPERFVGTNGAPCVIENRAAEGNVECSTVEGIPVLASFSRSLRSGWSVAIGIPRSELWAMLQQRLYITAVVGILLLVIGAITAKLISDRIARSIRSLQVPAVALAQGRPIFPPATEVVEVDEAVRVLVNAACDRDKLVREKEKIQDELRRSQQLEALGHLTGGVAHDFGNLLTPLIGNLDLMAKFPDDPRSAFRLSAARAAAGRAEKLVRSLLAFARQQPLEMAELDPNEVISGMAELLDQALGHKAKLILELGADIWPVKTDRTGLEMAVLNLVVNARDAITRNGIVRITTKNLVLHGEAGGFDGEFVALAVADTGSGMTPDVLARAFEPLFTTKPAGKGTGLGLSSLYGFVRQCGGTATIDSKPGEGTSVTIYLPRTIVSLDAADPTTSCKRDKSFGREEKLPLRSVF